MFELQFVYRKRYYCDQEDIFFGDCPHCMQCYTQCGQDMACKAFSDGYDGDPHEIHKIGNRRVSAFGDCCHAKIEYAYKGVTVKKYDIRNSDEDPFNPHLNCCEVTVGGITYECEKVILNGKCIYNEWDEEETYEN